MKFALVVALLTGAWAASRPWVQPSAPEPSRQPAPVEDAALDRELAELDARGAEIEDLTAEFEQQKFTALLKKPLVSSGTVRVHPPRTRWDTMRPRRSVLLLDEHELKLYDPEAATLEVYPVSGGLSRMTASPVPRLSAVRDDFSIERLDPSALDPEAAAESFVAIRLTPIDEEIKEHIAEVKVLIDRALACATLVEVTDVDGDRTAIRFRNVKTNTGLDSAGLDLDIPAGTKISRPLEGAPSGGAGR